MALTPEQLQAMMAQLVLQQPKEQDLTPLEGEAEEEAQRNQIREFANIGASAAEQMTGMQKGHRLGMDSTAKDALAAALKSKLGGAADRDRNRALIEMFRQQQMGSRQDKQLESLGQRHAETLGHKKEQLGQKKTEFEEKKSTKDEAQAAELAKRSEGATRSITKASEFMDRLEPYKGKDIPGFGKGQSAARAVSDTAADFFTSKEGKDLRGSYQSMINEFIKTYAGSAATKAEVERIHQEFIKNAAATEDDLINALDRIFTLYQTDAQRIMGGASEDAKRTFLEQGGQDQLAAINSVRNRLNNFRQAGNTSPQAVQSGDTKPGKVKVVLPDGRKGSIDASKLEAFKKKYPDAQILE